MADNAQDRNLPASQRKIRKAREEGQIARSRDLGHFVALLTASGLLAALAPQITGALQALLAQGLRFDATTVTTTGSMVQRLGEGLLAILVFVLPLGVALITVAVLAAVLSGGWNFSIKAVAPKWDKLDPIGGLGRVFSSQQFLQALKACGLALVLGLIAALFLKAQYGRFLDVLSAPMPRAFATAGEAVWLGIILLLLALAAFAAVDVPLQRFWLMKQLRMSHQEAKQEHKEVEGNAEVKAKQKARMREAANRRMLAAVPKADLVVMNPTHFAVALKYDGASMAAPKVVAKGADLMAFRIRDAARDAQVPVLQAPPLARALYAHAELDREIPAALFSAVAQVLAWVYQLRQSMAGLGRAPGELPELKVPAELDPLSKSRQATGDHDLDPADESTRT